METTENTQSPVIEAPKKVVKAKEVEVKSEQPKTLSVTSPTDLLEKVSDVEVFGDPEAWVLISKASSKKEEWMNSTKAMQIKDLGCLVESARVCKGSSSSSITFIQGCKIDCSGKYPKLVYSN